MNESREGFCRRGRGRCIIAGSCHNYHFCRDKSFVPTITFSRQAQDKSMVVATNLLSQQAYYCRDKRHVLSRRTRVCCDKSMLIATKLCLLPHICDTYLSRQNYVCRDKRIFVSRQKWYLWQLPPVTPVIPGRGAEDKERLGNQQSKVQPVISVWMTSYG